MDEKIKQLANALATQDKDPLIYIASPFFDEPSKAWVSAKEEEFEGMRIPFFSPRQDGINFNDVEGDIRAERITAIFKNNVRNLDKCKHITIYLKPCKGKIDIGTLWELGYFIGKHYNNVEKPLDFDEDEFNTIAASPEIKDLVKNWCKNLPKVVTNASLGGKTLLIKNISIDRVKESLETIDAEYNVKEISSILKDVTINGKCYFLIDEWPIQSFVLMGYLYAMGIPYRTISFKGYGSNVMIAASSKGHAQLPGLNDDRYRDKID